MSDTLDPYAVLEVCSTATQAELKASYRRLVKQHHPDAGGSEERILALNCRLGTTGGSRESSRLRSEQQA
jgi:DnaJ-class molecular chaperone with C-terminal Zn finger domain